MPDQVYVSLESIGNDASINVEFAKSLLSHPEQARAELFRFEIHRNRYIRGRSLLRVKLGELLATRPDALVIKEMERGKPFIPDHNLAFNVSHSGDLAIYTFSFTLSRLGVDIEKLDREVEWEQLSQHYFTEGERLELQKVSPDKSRQLFFKIWTAKEARMKLTGEGLYLEPSQIDLVFTNQTPSGYRKPEPTSLCLQIFDYSHLNAISAIVADQPFDTLSLV
jgi:4'-phosphopantetheinyl transferase